MGCTFCATGTMNLIANLTGGEILEQLYLANQVHMGGVDDTYPFFQKKNRIILLFSSTIF